MQLLFVWNITKIIAAISCEAKRAPPTGRAGGNLVERFFNTIKHYRGIATRYEKTACNFLADGTHALNA
jgi:hypothetical protein